eukprot:jgi/Ulvmu1/9194/UM005_0294.1
MDRAVAGAYAAVNNCYVYPSLHRSDARRPSHQSCGGSLASAEGVELLDNDHSTTAQNSSACGIYERDWMTGGTHEAHLAAALQRQPQAQSDGRSAGSKIRKQFTPCKRGRSADRDMVELVDGSKRVKGPKERLHSRGRARSTNSDGEDEVSDPSFKPPKSLQVEIRPATRPRQRQDIMSQSNSWLSSGSHDGLMPLEDQRNGSTPRTAHSRSPPRCVSTGQRSGQCALQLRSMPSEAHEGQGLHGNLGTEAAPGKFSEDDDVHAAAAYAPWQPPTSSPYTWHQPRCGDVCSRYGATSQAQSRPPVDGPLQDEGVAPARHLGAAHTIAASVPIRPADTMQHRSSITGKPNWTPRELAWPNESANGRQWRQRAVELDLLERDLSILEPSGADVTGEMLADTAGFSVEMARLHEQMARLQRDTTSLILHQPEIWRPIKVPPLPQVFVDAVNELQNSDTPIGHAMRAPPPSADRRSLNCIMALGQSPAPAVATYTAHDSSSAKMDPGQSVAAPDDQTFQEALLAAKATTGKVDPGVARTQPSSAAADFAALSTAANALLLEGKDLEDHLRAVLTQNEEQRMHSRSRGSAMHSGTAGEQLQSLPSGDATLHNVSNVSFGHGARFECGAQCPADLTDGVKAVPRGGNSNHGQTLNSSPDLNFLLDSDMDIVDDGLLDFLKDGKDVPVTEDPAGESDSRMATADLAMAHVPLCASSATSVTEFDLQTPNLLGRALGLPREGQALCAGPTVNTGNGRVHECLCKGSGAQTPRWRKPQSHVYSGERHWASSLDASASLLASPHRCGVHHMRTGSTNSGQATQNPCGSLANVYSPQ